MSAKFDFFWLGLGVWLFYLHDRVVSGLVDTSGFHTQERWLEDGLWATETFVTDGDDLTIRKLVGFLQSRRGSSGLHLLLKVQSDVSQLFFDVTNDFALGSGGERVTTLSQDFLKRRRQARRKK